MIITFIFMATTLFATYVAYRQTSKVGDLEQSVYEKTGIINHLQEHNKKLNNQVEDMVHTVNYTKSLIADLNRQVDELQKKSKAKPKTEKVKKATPVVKTTETKKRKYNKRKF